MVRVIIHCASFEAARAVAEEIARMGGRVIAIGRLSPYVVADVPQGALAMVFSMSGVTRIERDVEFTTQQVREQQRFFRGRVTTTMEIARALNLPDVWSTGYDGKGIKVAVIDGGIDASHPALRGRIVERIDVTGEGRPSVHGTHVAGIIVAEPGEYGGYELAGMAPGASIIDVKALTSGGRGRLSDVIRAIEVAVERGAKVINMSLGAPIECCFSTIRDVLARATEMGVIPVVAAGNYGPGKGTVACPACIPEVIAVGSIGLNVCRDQPAWFSSRGPGCFYSIKPDVSAYGGAGDMYGDQQPIERVASTGLNGSVVAMRGTSMATPVVAGIMALVAQAHPGLDIGRAKAIVQRLSVDVWVSGPDNDTGYGKPDPATWISGAGRVTPVTTKKIGKGLLALLAIGGLCVVSGK